MKKILLCAVLLVSASFTQAADLKPYSSLDNAPTVVGYIKNRANGKIVLTSGRASCAKDNKLFFYAVADGGKVVGGGCYSVYDDTVLATWNDDNSMYEYPFSAIELSQEWLAYIDSQP